MTDSARTTTLLSLVACALLLVALLWGGAPRSEDELDQLRRAVAQGEAALHLARLGCELHPEPEERADCHQALAAAELPLKVARGVLVTADACGEGAGACRDAQLARARELLPEARRLVEQLAASSASAPPPDPEAPRPPEPSGLAPPGEGGR
jgi:hypothetical protein